jgi:hypothetical protein
LLRAEVRGIGGALVGVSLSLSHSSSFSLSHSHSLSLSLFPPLLGFQRKIELWDVTYWSERLREASYEFEEEQLRAYFSLPKVLEGLFALAERLGLGLGME